MSVAIFAERRGQFEQLFRINPALAEGDFFGARDLQALPFFDGVDKLAGFEHGFVGAGVQPSIPPAKDLHVQLVAFQVSAVNVGNFQFATRRGLDVFGDVNKAIFR